jgi:hypothetical protein
MAVGADRIRRKAAVKGGDRGVAGEAKLSRALMGQHVPVDRPVGLMAGRASLNPDCSMLVDKRPLLVSMAFEACFILESVQPCPWRLLVSLVAVRALNHAFGNPVPFVEDNLFRNLAVAGQTELVAFLCQKLIPAHFRMGLVAVRAGDRAFHVVASTKEKILFLLAVAVQALLCFLRSRDRSLEAEDCFRSPACFHMGASLTVTGFAAFDLELLFLGEEMNGHLVILVLLLVAFLTGLRPDVVSPERSLFGPEIGNNKKKNKGKEDKH